MCVIVSEITLRKEPIACLAELDNRFGNLSFVECFPSLFSDLFQGIGEIIIVKNLPAVDWFSVMCENISGEWVLVKNLIGIGE